MKTQDTFSPTIETLFQKHNTTIYKGVAILLVILCHFMGKFGGGIVWFTPLGGIGVSIFLIVSGYGLSISWLTSRHANWWRKRIIAVFLPYILCQLIFYWPFHNFSVLSFVLDILLINPKYINGWYLSYILMWYVLFYATMRMKIKHSYKPYILLAISILSFFVFSKLSPIRAEQSLSFIIGVFFAEFNKSEVIHKFIKWRYSFALLAIGILSLAIKQTSFIRSANCFIYSFVEMGIKLPCALGIILFVFLLLKQINFKSIYLTGLISYELYLIHGYILEFVPETLLGALLFIAVTGVASTLLRLVFKKFHKPLNSLLRIH